MKLIERPPETTLPSKNRGSAAIKTRTPDRGPQRGKSVLCVGDRIGDKELLQLAPATWARLEPDAGRAIEACLAADVTQFIVQCSQLDHWALYGLAHLRTLRPDLEIVLLVAEAEPALLEGTLLEGIEVMEFPDS